MSAGEQPCEVALLEYAYGELSSADAAEVERHVARCAGCAQALEGMRGVRKVMAQLPDETAPEAGLDSLLAYAEQSARRTAAGPAPSPGTWRRWLAPVLGVGALATLALIALPVAEQARVPLPSTVAARVPEQAAAGEAPTPDLKAERREQRIREALAEFAAVPSAANAGAAVGGNRFSEDVAEAPGEGALPGEVDSPPARAAAPPKENTAPAKGGASAGRDEAFSLGGLGAGRGGLTGGGMAGGGGAALRRAEAGLSPAADLRAAAASPVEPVRSRAKEAKQQSAPQAEFEELAAARLSEHPAAAAAPAGRPPPALLDGFAEAKTAAAPRAKTLRESVSARDDVRTVASASDGPAPQEAPLTALRRAVSQAKGPAERQAALRRLCDAEHASLPASTPGCEQLAREFPADGGLSR